MILNQVADPVEEISHLFWSDSSSEQELHIFLH